MNTCKTCGGSYQEYGPAFQNGRRYVECFACGQGALMPLISEDRAIETIYQRENYMAALSHEESKGELEWLLDVATEFGVTDSRTPVLDFGAGRCLYHHLLAARGWSDVVSVEPNAALREQAQERYGLPAERLLRRTDDSCRGRFGLVLCNMVLEHTENPLAVMRSEIAPLLAPNGILVATVPHAKSLNRLICGRLWIGYSPEEHNWFFSAAAARVLVTSSGLTPVTVEPRTVIFTRHDGWRPKHPVKRIYKETVMRVAQLVGRGDALLIVAKKDGSASA